MTAVRQRFRDKVTHGALIPWTCILLGHRYGPYAADAWRYCRRPDCTASMQWTGAGS